MLPRFPNFRRLSGCALLLWAFVFLPTVRAQKQEEGILVKVKAGGSGNSEAFAFDGANKAFNTSAAVGNKQAQVKAFTFGGRSSVYGGGDGTFRSKTFDNPKAGGFRTDGYGVKNSELSKHNSFAQADKGFGTKSMDVRDAPGTDKAALVKDYAPASQTYFGRGKRQDMLDDRTRDTKNLSIDQVRDLLNKGPAPKPGTILEPVAPSVR